MIFLVIVFYSGIDASFPEILILFYTVMIPAVGEAGIAPGTDMIRW
jgi:Na+/H+-dicarboxylate symporter